ncbi:MAG: class B sortase [Oscillospiraceae bacterium]|nr:class B sortase [Oscillospiraceae bacterium]MCL2279928.1 class B sortase [Oscillospiraceae bacterium]
MKFKLIGSKGKRNEKEKRAKSFGKKTYFSTLALGSALIISALIIFVYILNEEAVARAEYDTLREIRFNPISPQTLTDESITEEAEGSVPEAYIAEGETEEQTDYTALRRLAMEELYEINNDFVGWISIADLIEYPVVRGRDNVRYLNRTFTGEWNRAGAIFMDYRNELNFEETITVLYGHLTGDNTMFSELHRFRNTTFLAENPYIEITTLDGEILIYRIFATRMTDAWNLAYTLSFTDTDRAIRGFPNAPRDASRFMLLSTCTFGIDDDERFLVFAVLVEG